LLAQNDTEMPVPPAAAATAPSRFYAGARVAAGDREGTAVLRRGNGWLVEFSGGGAVLEERQLTPLNSPTVHWMDAVIDAIGPEAEVVLLGDSTHGTQEYYSMRFEVAQSLVLLYGVTAIAVEGDCVAAGRVDRYVRGVGDDKTAEEALRGFACDDGGTTRWLWRNVPSENFVAWLREHNQTADVKVGFFGLDLFAADRSARAVVEYLGCVDHAAARRAEGSYACFLASASPDDYASACAAEARVDARACEARIAAARDACEKVLADLQVNRFDYWDIMGANQLLMAEMNAEVVVSAQQFYAKRLLEPDVNRSIRDQHMSQALLKLKAQLEMVQGQSPRIAVMAHNSHLGDGRATAHERQWNIGFLARETFGASVRIVGFSTYDGTVTALAPDGDRPTRQPLRPARADSAEALLHANYAAHSGPKVIDLQRPLPADERVVDALRGRRPQRFVGTTYLPDNELRSHYIDADVPSQYETLCF